jgi:hypothetical protein
MHFDIDSFQHRIQVASNIRIPEADNAVSFPLQPSLPFAVTIGGRVLVMMPAIEFDDETLCGAEEVHDIVTDWSLSPEMRAFDRHFF